MIKTQAPSNGIPIDPRDQRIAELETQLRERDQLIATLQEKVQHLEEDLKKTKRAGERQAAPFARKKRVAKPKRPGRKKGQGRFSYRRKPAPEQVKETKEAALDCCPGCGGSLTERKEHEQFVVDIPPVEPEITRKTTGCNRVADGAEAHSILASVLATCHQRAIPILDFLVDLQRATGNPLSLGPPQSAPT